MRTTVGFGRLSILAFATLTSVVPTPALAQSDSARVIERVTAASDTNFHYAIALPAGYDTSRIPRPILYVMDPRGRAMTALQLFRHPATRLGWIVVSSYETASDDPNAPNSAAMEALIDDTQRKWRADMSRIYLAGFSGTARFAWQMSAALQGNVRGVFMAGAGLSSYSILAFRMNGASTLPALAASAGTTDFNWSEVHQTEMLFESQPSSKRFWYWNGPHAWPPPSVAEEILDWFAADAMRRHLTPSDSAWLSARQVRLASRADSLQRAGDLEEALSLYRDIARDSATSVGATAAKAAAALSKSGAMRSYRDRVAAAVREETEAFRQSAQTLADFRRGQSPNEVKDLTARLHIAQLLKAARGNDSVRVYSARRRMEHLMGTLTFYEQRALLSAGDTARVRTLLRSASAIDSLRAERAARALGVALNP